MSHPGSGTLAFDLRYSRARRSTLQTATQPRAAMSYERSVRALEALRRCIVPNTWAISAPLAADIPLLRDCFDEDAEKYCFGIGPDRVRVGSW
jgi:hypothetical protein